MNKDELLIKISEDIQSVEIPDEFKNDYDVALAISKVNGCHLKIKKMNPEFLKDKQIILNSLDSNRFFINDVDRSFYDDKDIVLKIVNYNGKLLTKVSERLIDDWDVVVTAIRSDYRALYYASDRLKNDSSIIQYAKQCEEAVKTIIEQVNARRMDKINLFKSKSIWWTDVKVDGVKLDNPLTDELISNFQNKFNLILPPDYISLLKEQNGGRLIKRYYDDGKYEIDSILGISNEPNRGLEYVNTVTLDEIKEYFPDLGEVLIFAEDISAGHAHYMLDYNEDRSNPKVIYFDSELGDKRQLASSFREFIDGLSIEEEFEVITLPSDNLKMFIEKLSEQYM